MRILWLLPLLLAITSIGQSQPPTPAKSGQPKQDSTTTEESKRGGDKPAAQPVTITVVNPPEVNGAAKQHQNESSADWWMRIFTGLIFCATAVQAYIYWHQKNTMAAALVDSKRSTDLAHTIFISTHRPKLEIRSVSISKPIVGGTEIGGGRLTVINKGETKATLVKQYSTFFVANNSEEILPAIPPYEGKPSDTLPGESLHDIELAPGQLQPLDFPTHPKTLVPPEHAKIRRAMDNVNERTKEGHGPLWLVGWIKYKDSEGRLRINGFARRYNFTTKRFDRDTDPDYEYDD